MCRQVQPGTTSHGLVGQGRRRRTQQQARPAGARTNNVPARRAEKQCSGPPANREARASLPLHWRVSQAAAGAVLPTPVVLAFDCTRHPQSHREASLDAGSTGAHGWGRPRGRGDSWVKSPRRTVFRPPCATPRQARRDPKTATVHCQTESPDRGYRLHIRALPWSTCAGIIGRHALKRAAHLHQLRGRALPDLILAGAAHSVALPAEFPKPLMPSRPSPVPLLDV